MRVILGSAGRIGAGIFAIWKITDPNFASEFPNPKAFDVSRLNRDRSGKDLSVNTSPLDLYGYGAGRLKHPNADITVSDTKPEETGADTLATSVMLLIHSLTGLAGKIVP